MPMEKSWERSFEKEIYEKWEHHPIDLKPGKKLFSIDTPPPYVNSPIHIGQATTYVMMDMFARFHRMIGHAVLFPLGLDRNGLPIEMAAEKKFNISLITTPRENFIEYCRKILEDSSNATADSYRKLGISFNSYSKGNEPGDVYHTDSPEFRALTQSTFIDLWHKGLVYEDERINNYCPGCRTTIADAEIERKDAETTLNYVHFTIKGTNKKITIATTRPELLCTAALVVFNPKDDRYKQLAGSRAVVPVLNIEVPIIAHPIADPAFGSGIVFMSRSAGDQDAVRFLREMNIEPKMAIGIDGKMNENAGFLKGMKTAEARACIIDELQRAGALEKQEKITHSVPICERSKHQIEFISMREYYLKQVEFKDELKKMQKGVKFFSERSRQLLDNWIDSVTIDWPVSRRRYYATEIPLWYCTKCNEPFVPQKGRYYQPWREPPPGSPKCKCGSGEFRGEERVFDTWFDSSNTPLYILKYGTEFFKHFPCTLRPQGKEIVRTWLYYTLLKSYHLLGKMPFDHVWINFHVVDNKGKKMSKSLGNTIDPHDIIEKYGAEPFRLWSVIEGNLTNTDFRCSFDRIDGAGKTLNKLWNVAKFVAMFPEPKLKKLMPADAWIINEIDDIAAEARKNYEEYDFHTTAAAMKHFLWETFASHYIELVKNRAYNQSQLFTKEEEDSARYALHYCLKTTLKLWAPVIPFITYKIFMEMYGKDIHTEQFPAPGKKREKIAFRTVDIEELNSLIWKTKRDAGLSLKAAIKELAMPERLKSVEKDIAAAHSAKKILYSDNITIKLGESE